MEEVGIAEQFLLAPHHLFAAYGHGVEHRVAHLGRQLRGPLLDDHVARVRLGINGVPEAHHLFLASQHAQQFSFCFVGAAPALDHVHGGLVGAAMQRAAQRANRRCHAGVHVRQGGGTHPGCEGRGIEFVFRIQNQRHVHHLGEQGLGRLVAEHVQEVRTDGVIVQGRLDAHAVVGIAVPVADDRGQHRHQAVDDIILLREAVFGLKVSQHGAAGAHHIHGVGAGRNALQYFFQGLRKGSQGFDFVGVSV